ncbi:hypothetical protein ACIBKY_50950 [Nonomuraea sp. NPDC050394]|uniref:hypothetical protein n=1 Tax=Nonomuraea sp. NPDC050394 TaxID=3364363 RepID=UPI003795E556
MGPRTPTDHMGAMTARENINKAGALADADAISVAVASTYQYRNVNTGQTAEYSTRSTRLDRLENWLLIGAPSEPDPADDGAPVQPDPAAQVIRPAEHENKREWVAYAIWRGMPERDARALSKQALITEFGTEEDDDG